MKEKMRLIVRRAAANVIGDYPAPAISGVEDLLAEIEMASRLELAGAEWVGFASAIKHALRTDGADQFLRLAPVAKTLHSRQRSLTRRYLTYLLRSRCFSTTIQKALTESPVGKPLVNPQYPLSSPLLMQHGYKLIRLLEATDFDLSTLHLAAEFGGGYGSFFRLLRNLGYRNPYIICDLPVMCALQKFYLRNVFPSGPPMQPPDNVQWLSGNVRDAVIDAARDCKPSLFVATWSLSETPANVRAEISPALAGFTFILIAYQRDFGKYDNTQYFGAMRQDLPQFKWVHFECPVYRNNFYLIGQRTGAIQHCWPPRSHCECATD
jgi:hypothetical protein